MGDYSEKFGYMSNTSNLNRYLDDLFFVVPNGENANFYQIRYVMLKFIRVRSAYNILKPYSTLMKHLKKEVDSFGINKKTFLDAYAFIPKAIDDIYTEYNETNVFNQQIFQKGILMFNDKFYSDLQFGELDDRDCIDAIIKMSKSLKQVISSNKK